MPSRHRRDRHLSLKVSTSQFLIISKSHNLNILPSQFLKFSISPSLSTPLNSLMLQNATSKKGRGGTRKLPLAFTEHGALMAANVLKSSRAITMSVYVVRAFVRLCDTLSLHKTLAHKLEELERKVASHDSEIQTIIDAIHRLMAQPEKPKHEIGFRVKETKVQYKAHR